MTSTRIQICGRVAVELAGRRVEDQLPGGQAKQLLVYLILNRSRSVGRDELAAAIWQDSPPPGGPGTLRTILSRLRSAVGTDRLVGREELRLDLPPDSWIDLEAAASKIHEAEAAIHGEDWPRAWVAATIAWSISERGFLPGTEAPWVLEQRSWLEDVHIRALECDGIASLGLGGSELAAAERDGRRLIRLAPYRESGYRLMMRALERRGEPAEALLVYERLRTLLREELGTSPSPATQAVHSRLLARSG